MTLSLLTEVEARSQGGSNALIVRESRGWADCAGWLVCSMLAITGLSYPFWREQLLPHAHFPSFFAVFGGLFCWLFAVLMRSDLKAVRQSSNWLLIQAGGQLRINFRSFHHWRWPVTDKTVLQLSSYDVDYIQPRSSIIVTGSGDGRVAKKICQLEFHLHTALSPDQAEVVQFENIRREGKFSRSRYVHTPLLASADGLVLTLDFGRTQPSFMDVIGLLTPLYTIRPMADIVGASAQLFSLTSTRIREIEALAAAGDKLGAIQLLRQCAKLSLREAKEAVEQGIERKLGSHIRRD